MNKIPFLTAFSGMYDVLKRIAHGRDGARPVSTIAAIMLVTMAITFDAQAQTYDPVAVQRINALIANNGLAATPDAPETWSFATWNNATPRQLTRLELYSRNLTGAASFAGLTALTYLNCFDNNLTELDVSNCIALRILGCSNNNLTELDVSNCIATLQELSCNHNSLTKLDVSNFTALRELGCNNNSLTKLDVSNCSWLQSLGCNNNSLTELDVSTCTELRGLGCINNNLTELDVSNNPALEALYCDNNNLIKLNVSNCAVLYHLYCHNNSLTELDISTAGVYHLYCYNNSLTELDVSNRPELTNLHCYNNNLTKLDVSNNTVLEWLYCDNNNLTELNVTNCTALQRLQCANNSLTALDLTGLDNLYSYTGSLQNVSLTLDESDDGEYTLSLALNSPVFVQSAITYETGVLKSTDKTVENTGFTVQTGKTGFELSGVMAFEYVVENITFTITYELNGGANHAENPATYTIESPTITLQDPTRDGYTFAGWEEGNTIESGSTGNKTFTAQWDIINIINYDITYELNGGTNHADNPATYTIESPAITLQDPTRDGYTFTGWEEGNTIESGSTGDKTFTAQWDAANNGLLDFDTYVATKWDNNTFMLNLSLLEDNGYDVTGCKWYQGDAELIAPDWRSYSAGPKSTDRLDAGVYRFALTTNSHGTLFSTEKIIEAVVKSLLVYPNPVQSGAMLVVEGVVEGSPIEVYNQSGLLVRHVIATGSPVTLTLNLPAGVYIVRTGTGDVKIVVN